MNAGRWQACSVVCLFGMSPALAQAQATFTWLGALFPGSDCIARAVSADGFVVAGECSGRPFRWSVAHGMQPLAPLPQQQLFYFVNDLSADGRVAVGSGNPLGAMQYAIRWTLDIQAEDLGVIDSHGSSPLSSGDDVSYDGGVVSGRTNDGAFIWDSQAGIRLLGFSPQFTTIGMSDDGGTIAGIDIFLNRLFFWTRAAGLEQLQSPCAPDTTFTDAFLSNDGSTLLGNCGLTMYRWRRATGFLALPTPFGGISIKALSGDGRVIVGNYSGGVWIGIEGGYSGPLVDLLASRGVDTSEWYLDGALDLSADGNVIVGFAHCANGGPSCEYRAWIAALNPVCGSSDYNHDQDFGTDQDIEDFVRCLSGDCCSTCYTADFNGDGIVGDGADIESFFRVLGGGNC